MSDLKKDLPVLKNWVEDMKHNAAHQHERERYNCRREIKC